MYANVTVSSQYAFAAGSAFLSMDWCATGSNNIKLIFVAVALRTPWPKASGVGKLAAKWPPTVCFPSTHKGIFGSSRWQQSESGQKERMYLLSIVGLQLA